MTPILLEFVFGPWKLIDQWLDPHHCSPYSQSTYVYKYIIHHVYVYNKGITPSTIISYHIPLCYCIWSNKRLIFKFQLAFQHPRCWFTVSPRHPRSIDSFWPQTLPTFWPTWGEMNKKHPKTSGDRWGIFRNRGCFKTLEVEGFTTLQKFNMEPENGTLE